MDVERGIRGLLRGDELGPIFKATQVLSRILVWLYNLAVITILGWLYSTWRSQPTVRVDVIFPSFFPVAVAVLMDGYEIVSLMWLKRKAPTNLVAVGVDFAVTIGSMVCFLVLSLVDYGNAQSLNGEVIPEAAWAADMRNAMILMIVHCALHAVFIIIACGGCVYGFERRTNYHRKQRIAQARTEMVQFQERHRAAAARGSQAGQGGLS